MLGEYVTVAEAAEILGVTPGRIRQFICEHRLVSELVHDRMRVVKLDDLREFAAKTGRTLTTPKKKS